MASNDLRHRLTLHPDTAANDNGMIGDKRQKRKMMAKRGLKSLAIAVTLPFLLTVLSACIGSSITADDSLSTRRPFWFPPSWAVHFTCPAISFLTGMAAWMVWAEGGFHRNRMALLFYFTQILFAVLWDPLVFAAGATRLSLMLCLGLFVSQYGCMLVFRSVNPIAADLIKPSLAWVAFLSIVNIKLLFI
ncbi:translocator protein homolog [Vigna umbellata]|uniref:translocator protein homolog n=1 Tax=Vigna umbellata TaxID=87088 RepID=UPI001F5F649D|nr:translocator protein homolog [Vigna umbellata]